MPEASAGYRVQFPPERPRLAGGVRVVPQWDEVEFEERGDAEEIVFDPRGLGGLPTLQGALRDLRARPSVAVQRVDAVQTLQDTEVLWLAWKASVLDTLATAFEQWAQLVLQNAVGAPEDEVHATRRRLREVREQVQTTLGTWREHGKFIGNHREFIANEADQRKIEAAGARHALDRRVAELDAEDRASANARVLTKAAEALDSTRDERRAMMVARAEQDRAVHVAAIAELTAALRSAVRGLIRNFADLQAEADKATAHVDASIQAKRGQWRGVCRRMQTKFTASVLEPLRAVLASAGRPAPGPLLAQGLDDDTDPYCIQRCDAVARELEAAIKDLRETVSATRPTPVDALDDAALREAKARRGGERVVAQSEHAARMAELAQARRGAAEALARAKQHLAGLQRQSVELQQQLGATWTRGDDDADATRRMAAVTRAVELRQDNLREEMQRTEATIEQRARDVAAAAAQITDQDRLFEAERCLALTVATRDVCRRMQSQFETAVGAERLTRRMVREQYNDSLRTLHDRAAAVIAKSVEATRAKFAATRVELDAQSDAVHEATRRMGTLNKARIAQEVAIDGNEVAVYSALEEYVASSQQHHHRRDALAETTAMVATVDAATELLQRLANTLASA